MSEAPKLDEVQPEPELYEIGYKLKKMPALITGACPRCDSSRVYYDPRVLELATKQEDLAMTCGCGARLVAKHRVIIAAGT